MILKKGDNKTLRHENASLDNISEKDDFIFPDAELAKMILVSNTFTNQTKDGDRKSVV